MARGWESKSVEDQIAAAEQGRAARTAQELTDAERGRVQRVGTLQLARARILQQLQGVCDRRYRAQLEQSLADLDAELQRAL
jgi:hypothetical protein